MKGIILAGGEGTRLYPCTIVTSKQLLPVYDRPMIFYPLNTLIKAGIKDILIIVAPGHSGQFMELLGDFLENFGIKISFQVQREPRGLPEAFILGENHIDNDNVALILGDNIFEDDFSEIIRNFKSGAHVFVKSVPDPERFGVLELDKRNKIKRIVEKPKDFVSSYAVTGLYLYDAKVVKFSKRLKPSSRGELEIVDCHNFYLKRKQLEYTKIQGAWMDAGNPEALLEAATMVRNKKIYEKFDPILNKAIKRFCEDHKSRMKRRLHA